MVWRIWGCDFGNPEKYFSFMSEDIREILHCVNNWPTLPCYHLMYDENKTTSDTEFNWVFKFSAFSLKDASGLKGKLIETIEHIINTYKL